MKETQSKFSLALITGASSGIGEGLCRLLARQGISLLITCRNPNDLTATAEELRKLVQVEIIGADLSVAEDRKRLIEKISERTPDLIINNAGFGLYGMALSHETSTQTSIIEVNVKALLELTLESARILVSIGKKGVLLNVSSSADLIVFPGLTVYAASKAFVTQFSRSLDEEMKPLGIRVLVSCPGVVETAFRSRASGVANAKSDKGAMTVPFAAEQIWKQIVTGKQIHHFDLKTRIGVFFARFIIPQFLLSKILFRTTESYHPSRSLIKKR